MLLALGFGLAEIMWLETALIVVTGVMLASFAFSAAPQLRVGPAYVTAATARQLTGLGGWMFLNALSTSLIEQTDRIVIGLFLAVEAVTYYSAAWKLYMLVYSVSTTLVQAIWPVAAGLHAAGDRLALQRLWLRMTKYTAALTWPLGWSLGLCAGPILHYWVGESFAAHYTVVQVLVATFIVTAHNHAAFGVLGAMRRVGPIVQRYSVPQAVLNLVLSLWLVRPLGILGVAVGTMLPALLLEYTFLSFVLRELGLGWGDFWREVVRPTVVPADAGLRADPARLRRARPAVAVAVRGGRGRAAWSTAGCSGATCGTRSATTWWPICRRRCGRCCRHERSRRAAAHRHRRALPVARPGRRRAHLRRPG